MTNNNGSGNNNDNTNYYPPELIESIRELLNEFASIDQVTDKIIANVIQSTYHIVRNFRRNLAKKPRNNFISNTLSALYNSNEMVIWKRKVQESGKCQDALQIIDEYSFISGADTSVIDRLTPLSQVNIENFIKAASGKYICVRRTFQKDGDRSRVSVSWVNIERSSIDKGLCGFSEVECIIGKNVIKTVGYVVPIGDFWYFLGTAVESHIPKTMYFSASPRDDTVLRHGFISTQTNDGRLPFSAAAFLEPVGKFSRARSYTEADFLEKFSHYENYMHILDKMAQSDGVLRPLRSTVS